MTIIKEANHDERSWKATLMPRVALFAAGTVALFGAIIVALVSMKTPDFAGVFAGAVEAFVAAVVTYVLVRSAGWLFVGHW